MYCKECGSELNDDDSFCMSCGAPVAAVEGEAPDAEQTTPVSDQAAQPVAPAPKKPANAKLIVVLAVVVVLAIVAGIVAFVVWQGNSEQDAAREQEVVQVVATFQSEIDALPPVSSLQGDREALLKQFQTLERIATEVQAAEDDGSLTLRNGSLYDTAELRESISQREREIRQWFVDDYEKRIAQDTLPESANADNTSREACQKLIDDLAKLKSQIEGEAIIWQGDTGDGSQYKQLLTQVSDALVRDNQVMVTISEREAQLQNREPLGAWYTSDNGRRFGPIFEAGGGFALNMPDHYTEGTWRRTGDGSNGTVAYTAYFLGGSKIATYYYNPTTDTLTDDSGRSYTRG